MRPFQRKKENLEKSQKEEKKCFTLKSHWDWWQPWSQCCHKPGDNNIQIELNNELSKRGFLYVHSNA